MVIIDKITAMGKLEIRGTLTKEALKKAYRDKAKLYHPDIIKNKDNYALATEQFKVINEANDFLEKYLEKQGYKVLIHRTLFEFTRVT